MILLGSIDRLELLALCDWWLSPERRLLMQVSQRSCWLVLRHEHQLLDSSSLQT